jgi:hypothetical protein
MAFLLKTKTSKKDVPIDRLPFMISEKTDCLGSRFFRITTYYLLPLRISFSTLSTCCRCTFQLVLLLHTSHHPAHFTLLCLCAFHFPRSVPAAHAHFVPLATCCQYRPHIVLTGCLTYIRHFIAPNSIRNFLSQFYNFYAFNNGLVRLQNGYHFLSTKDKKKNTCCHGEWYQVFFRIS